MAKGKKSALTEFVGVSAPEIPKYLVMNNFLLKYFKSLESFKYENILNWDKDIFVNDEKDDRNKEKLKKSFLSYFNAYSGHSMSKITKKIFFPILPDMLSTNDQFNLRHLLYALQMKSVKTEADYKNIQDLLYNYIFSNSEAETHSILKYICGNSLGKENYFLPYSKYDGKNEFGANYNKPFFRVLSKQFNIELQKILCSKNLLSMDFYKRIDFLSTFLVFYVIEYLLERTNEIDNRIENVILCKGSTDFSLQSGQLHRACLNNYSNIRARFLEMVKSHFKESVDQIGADRFLIELKDATILITGITGEVYSRPLELIDFLKTWGLITIARNKERLQKIFVQIFLNEKDQVTLEKDDFTLNYFNVQKKMGGSSITKISSILPTSGREIKLVFPRSTARQKFFAMSEEMGEFFVRLYLTQIDNDYDYFESFLDWLIKQYKIYINVDDTLKNYLRKINAGVSVEDGNLNELEFIQILTKINCLIKLSDSGYLVILPEKKGDFKLL